MALSLLFFLILGGNKIIWIQIIHNDIATWWILFLLCFQNI